MNVSLRADAEILTPVLVILMKFITKENVYTVMLIVASCVLQEILTCAMLVGQDFNLVKIITNVLEKDHVETFMLVPVIVMKYIMKENVSSVMLRTASCVLL